MATGSEADTQQPGRPRSGRSEENIQELEKAYALSQGKSVGRAAVEQDISRTISQLMFRKDIKVFSCKLQTEHNLEKEDDSNIQMCETVLNYYENDPSILDNIWFNDEAVFLLSGRVNRHHTPILETENF